MYCQKCRHEVTRVIDSRITDEGSSTRRRRECEKCGYRFTTFERRESTGLIVSKTNNLREPFSREKLEKSIWTACGKRPVTRDEVENMISELEEKWGNNREISSRRIGEDVMKSLKKLDHVAYIRFASVYRSFKDVEDFKKEISALFGDKNKNTKHNSS